jgi:hypothetical protein
MRSTPRRSSNVLESLEMHNLATLPSQWFLAPARLYTYQPLLQIAQIPMFCRKRALLSALYSARENFYRGHHLVTGSQSKPSHVLAWIWSNSDHWLVNHCAMPSIGQTWVLASIGAVVEMGVLSALKRLLMESKILLVFVNLKFTGQPTR